MKKSKVCLLISGIIILLLAAGVVISRMVPTPVSLSSLQKGDIYQFKNFKWGASENTVKLLWTDSLDSEAFDLPEQEIYLARESCKLDDKNADVYFYFRDDGLYQVCLTFKDCNEAWFNTLLSDLRQLYGEETENVKDMTYKWDMNNTRLAITAPTEHTNHVLLVIGEISETD